MGCTSVDVSVDEGMGVELGSMEDTDTSVVDIEVAVSGVEDTLEDTLEDVSEDERLGDGSTTEVLDVDWTSLEVVGSEVDSTLDDDGTIKIVVAEPELRMVLDSEGDDEGTEEEEEEKEDDDDDLALHRP